MPTVSMKAPSRLITARRTSTFSSTRRMSTSGKTSSIAASLPRGFAMSINTPASSIRWPPSVFFAILESAGKMVSFIYGSDFTAAATPAALSAVATRTSCSWSPCNTLYSVSMCT